jgi:hypothetical protein
VLSQSAYWELHAAIAQSKVLAEQLAVPFFTKQGEQPALEHPNPGSLSDTHSSALEVGLVHALVPPAHWPLSSLSRFDVNEQDETRQAVSATTMELRATAERIVMELRAEASGASRRIRAA